MHIYQIKLSGRLIFYFALLGLVLPILLHNHLTPYENKKSLSEFFNSFEGSEIVNNKIIIPCNEQNNFCEKYKTTNLEKQITATECSKYQFRSSLYEDKSMVINEDILKLGADAFRAKLIKQKKEFFFIGYNLGLLNERCLKNSNIFFLYEIFPNLKNFYFNIKKETSFSSGEIINPFIYGETSVSNIAKRFPFNYIFKSFMFLTSFLMVLYWCKYFLFFRALNLFNKNYFFYFGLVSSISLFFHVLFLGSNYNLPYFDEVRKIILLIFIFSELFAEFFLAKKIYNNKEVLFSRMKNSIINLKILFVYTALTVTLVSIVYIINFNTSSEFNNILEWNYFTFLLFFYLLSSVIWKNRKI